MHLHVLGIGKLKDPHAVATCDEYVRRSRPFLPIERHEVKDLDASWARAEALRGPAVVLDERGEQVTSQALADILRRYRDAGVRNVAFLIGDAHGFTERDRARADRTIALSRLTLPHRLATVLVCEQLYRAGTILAGHPYHHA